MRGDWVTLAAASAPDSSYLAWQYLNGGRTVPATGMPGATLQFMAPLTPGAYTVRFFANGGFTKLATSAEITVQAPPATDDAAQDAGPGGGRDGGKLKGSRHRRRDHRLGHRAERRLRRADHRLLRFHERPRGPAVAPYDDYGHGTHIAGLIGSSGQLSNYGFQGIAPGVRLIGLKVLDGTGAGNTSDVIAALQFVTANKAVERAIVNMSLGHPI